MKLGSRWAARCLIFRKIIPRNAYVYGMFVNSRDRGLRYDRPIFEVDEGDSVSTAGPWAICKSPVNLKVSNYNPPSFSTTPFYL